MQVVVVGAGVFGAWTARWLLRRGASVTLVEQYAPGNSLSSSGGESRVTRSAHGPDELYPRWQRRALAAWRELEAQVHRRLFVPTGVLWFVHADAGFEADSYATLVRLGIPVERLNRAALANRFPQVRTDDVAWALFEPEAGVLMARRAVAASAERFGAEGGRVLIGRVVPPDETDGARLAGVRLASGDRVPADAVVFAVGPWLAGLLGAPGGLSLEVPQQEIVYFATPPGDGRFDAGSLPTWVDYDRAFYGLPSIEGRGFKVAPDWPGPTVDPDRQERRLSDERVEAARGYLRDRFPALAAQPVSEGRVCQYELTADTHFVIDRHPAWENAWVVGGGSGHGFKHAPSVGEYLSALVLGEAPPDELVPPDERFTLRPRAASLGMRTSGAVPPS